MNKQNVDYNNAYNGILILKRNEILIHAATWMNLENIMLSEISQRQKNKCDTIKYVVFVSMNLLILGKRLSKG